ncbi:hypothetical protein C2E19_16940 [Pseudomonas sp. DTU12.3]|uniref:hypothetical protein n=1 Tax=Pseudomonas sp. DTU12.3 TaxID=2073078 RepID=UPI00101189BC|nr:hypothetical protein [Pseudomonas sp. DTU12.3]QAX85437.1 hypothetical protein C2E19_16940 [Pseudomonas sp. DTU12.3]
MFNRFIASRERMAVDLSQARLLVGQPLRALLHDQYSFNGEPYSQDVGSLLWQFGENQTLAMYLLSDGESVGADQAELQLPASFCVGEDGECSWRREDLLAELSSLTVAGKLITQVQGVIDQWPDQQSRLVAFKITFETGDYLIYLNRGDDAVVLINEMPPEVVGVETRLEVFTEEFSIANQSQE